MKISKIKISKFHQFEDFELDLTYPKGHEKAGKPLDKVCFIGQSGTGKTTLLEMIKQVCLDANFSNPRYNYEYERKKFEEGQGAYFIFEHNKENFTVTIDSISSGFSKQLTSPIANVLLYFSTGLAQAKLEEEARVLNEVVTEEEQFSHYEPKVKPLMYFPITYTSLQPIWDSFYHFIREYQQIEANFRINLTRRYEKEKVDLVGNTIGVGVPQYLDAGLEEAVTPELSCGCARPSWPPFSMEAATRPR
ncbi:MAG: AAA family ATPase [Saprospiraceae bacterium]|nr:AAA family ATPase [Saprospiraceae bacterium]